jgi:ubiquinone/menaquinone biosynthesis C-methylase UbiE
MPAARPDQARRATHDLLAGVVDRGSSVNSEGEVFRGHRLFAALYDALTRSAERRFLSAQRGRLAESLAGRVLDLGAGTGANFPHVPRHVDLVAIEPDPHMRRRALTRAEHLSRQVRLLAERAEQLSLADESVDHVLATLVLCTVTDPGRALAEARRVLRPGGSLRFLEHVRSERSGWARLQDVAAPVWKRIAAGCHPNRDTVGAIEGAGFRMSDLEQLDWGPVPGRIMARGIALRP